MAKNQKRKYTVKEKVAHYNEVMAKSEQAQKQANNALYQTRLVSFAAGYNQAADDCREIMREVLKKQGDLQTKQPAKKTAKKQGPKQAK